MNLEKQGKNKLYKVIIVDDEKDVRERLEKIILEKSNNYQIVGIFENGADALEGVITLKPDILVTDVKIPYINGMDLIEQVKLEVPYLKSIY